MSKLETISVTYRDKEVAKNEFSYSKEYNIGNKEAVSPLGLGENDNGDVGTTIDIKTRAALITKNPYSYNNEYNAGND
jgi:hypothetical protein